MDFYPFQDVPGLLSPAMTNNVRTQSLLGAASGLLNASGWSSTPPSIGSMFGNALQGGVEGYERGTNNAVRQMLLREQIQKLVEQRRQQELWRSIFGGPSGGGGGAPASTGGDVPSVPTGLLSPRPIATDPNMTPETSGSMVGAPGERIIADTTAGGGPGPAVPQGLLSPAPIASTPPTAGAQPVVTPRAVRSAPAGGLRDAIAALPQAVREVIGIAGPTKGMEILQKRITDKPSDSFINVESPEGKRTSFRADDSRLDRAIASGWKIVATPSPAQNLVTLTMPEGGTRSFREGDPAVDKAIAAGAVPVTRTGQNLVTLAMPGGGTQSFREGDPAVDAAIAAGAKPVTTKSQERKGFVTVELTGGGRTSFREDDPMLDRAVAGGAQIIGRPPADTKPDNYMLPDGRTVLSRDGKTYVSPEGTKLTLPSDAIRVDPTVAYDVSRTGKLAARAENEVKALTPAEKNPPAEGPSKVGTGPYSSLQAGFNAVAGGLGVDVAFGKTSGFFPENEANRAYLRNIKQSIKTAFVNNPRFPVAEQRIVDELIPNPDEFWSNPRTEAQKIPLLRNTLRNMLTTNNEALATGILTKQEASTYVLKNVELRRALTMLGEGDASLRALGGKDQQPAPTSPTAGATPPEGSIAAVPVGNRVVQQGVIYQKEADGTMRALPKDDPAYQDPRLRRK